MRATGTAIVGGHGKTGRAVAHALARRGVEPVLLGRADWPDLAGAMAGCDAAYVVAPNFHPDEPAYVAQALAACRAAGVGRVGYHSVASPYLPAMAHHVGKAAAEDVVRRSGLAWTILQPGVYLQNFDLTGPVGLPYDVDARFGFLDLADLGEAVATVLVEDGHVGRRTSWPPGPAAWPSSPPRPAPPPCASSAGDAPPGLRAMFAYYDEHGLPAGTLPLRALLKRL